MRTTANGQLERVELKAALRTAMDAAQAVNAYEWVDHPDFGRLPVANIPGITPLRDTQDRSTAPDPGQHTRDILGGFDLSDDTVEKLIADGIVQQLDTSGR